LRRSEYYGILDKAIENSQLVKVDISLARIC